MLNHTLAGLASIGAVCLFAGQSTAQCSQQGNAVLTAPAKLLPGSSLEVSLTGAQNNMPAILGLSAGAGPINFPFGKVCLSLPTLVLISGTTPMNLKTLWPAGFAPKTTLHFQGFVFDSKAPNGFLAFSASRSVETLPGLSVYSDAGLFDTLGSFQGGGASIGLKEIKDKASAPEGEKYQQASFNLPAGWAGLFIQVGAFNTTTSANLSAVGSKGFLRFMVRSTNELEVGVRSQNIGPGQERSKLLLRKESFAKLNGTWESVAIPLSRFKALDARLDFSQMKVLLAIAVTKGFVSASAGKFEFDHVRWSN